jgi:hypothetical protein
LSSSILSISDNTLNSFRCACKENPGEYYRQSSDSATSPTVWQSRVIATSSTIWQSRESATFPSLQQSRQSLLRSHRYNGTPCYYVI